MKSLTAAIAGATVMEALRGDRVITLLEGQGVSTDDGFRGGQVFVVGHNVLDAWTERCTEKRAEEFRVAIKKAYKPGVEVILVCCFPARLPEDLRRYTLDPESDKSWCARDRGAVTDLYEDEDDIEVCREVFEDIKKEREEFAGREEVKKWVEEWGLDWRYVREVWGNWVYKKGVKEYVWKWGEWYTDDGRPMVRDMDYGKDLRVQFDAPELGFYKAQYID